MRTHRLLLAVFILAGAWALLALPGQALPVLQIDIEGGSYNPADPNVLLNESTLINSDQFTVDAIFTPGGGASIPADTYYLIIAFADRDGNAVTGIDSGQVLVVGVALSTFYQGTPSGLPPYGPYPTYYASVEFNFESAVRITTYNVEEDPGDPILNPTGQSLMMQFDIDRSGLSSDYLITFDLVGGGKFAPPSHNGASVPPVPEPGTIGLLGIGAGLLAARKWMKRK